MKQKGDSFILRNLIIVAFIYVICIKSLHSQGKIENYPVQFHQYIFSYPIINPSSLGVNNENELILCYQKPISGFTGISTYFFNFSFSPFPKERGMRNKSVLGIRLLNDREGAYINRTRFYGMYAFHTKIASKLNFGGGIDFGGFNYSVKATPTTSGASAFVTDANSGIWLYNNQFHLGFSINQMFNNSLQPLDEVTYLPVHFNLTFSRNLISSKMLIVKPHILITYPYYSRTSIQSSLYGLFYNKLIGVIGWNYHTDISIILGLHKISIYGGNLDLMFSYSSSVKQESIGLKMIELSLVYCIKSKFNNK